MFSFDYDKFPMEKGGEVSLPLAKSASLFTVDFGIPIRADIIPSNNYVEVFPCSQHT